MTAEPCPGAVEVMAPEPCPGAVEVMARAYVDFVAGYEPAHPHMTPTTGEKMRAVLVALIDWHARGDQ